MAITGPFQRTVSIPGLIWTRRTWYRQKPVSSAPLPYIFEVTQNIGQTGYPDPADYTGWSVSTLTDPAVWPGFRYQLYAKAYGRFMANVSAGAAQLGADFGERKQAYNSVLARTGQLLKAARALRNRDLAGFGHALGIRRRTIRQYGADAGSTWLEYSFGWKPLVIDIHTAVNIIQRPFPFKIVKGKAQGKLVKVVDRSNLPYASGYDQYTWHLRLLLQARVSVSNWVAWRANELGLINPLSIAWELTPLSFVIDWFLPIGKYLQSLTDFVGLNLDESFNTWYGILNRKRVVAGIYASYKPYDHTYHARRVDMIRSLSLPAPPVLRPRFTGFYSARGANAIALLTSTLKDLPNVKNTGRIFKMSRDMYNWERNAF